MKRISYVIISMFISGCIYVSDDKHEDVDTVINISNAIEGGSPFTENLIDSCIFVPLETNKNSIVGDISKIVICDSLMVVMDFQKQIKIFNLKGQFLYTLGEIGHAKNELFSRNNFFVDSDNDKLYVFDAVKLIINEYDYNGTFLSSTICDKIFQDGSDILRLPDGKIMITMAEGDKIKCNFLLCDSIGSNKFLEVLPVLFKSKSYGKCTWQKVYNANNSCFAFKHLGNIIYSYDKGEYTPKYKLIGDMKFIDDSNKSIIADCEDSFDAQKRLIDKGYFSGINSIIATDNHILLPRLLINGQRCNFYWDVEQDKGYKFPIAEEFSFLETKAPVSATKNSFISYITPDILLKEMNTYKTWGVNSNIKALSNIKADNNPVIIFFVFKKSKKD